MIDEIFRKLETSGVKTLSKYRLDGCRGVSTEYAVILHKVEEQKLEVAFLVGTDLKIVANTILLLDSFDIQIIVGDVFLYIDHQLISGADAITYYEKQRVHDIVQNFITTQQQVHMMYFSEAGEC